VDALFAESSTSNGTTTTSFNSLERKLETLLQDSVGGTPRVNLTTTSNAHRSDLVVDIVLAWNWLEHLLVNVDLETLMEDENTTGVVGVFAKNLVPGEGEASVDLKTGVSFRLGVGLEYVSSEKRINPYILGTTGFYVELGLAASGAYTVQAGPFEGALDFQVEASGVQETDPLSLSVGLNNSLNYYVYDPGNYSKNRNGFITVPGIKGLTDKLNVDFDGSIRAQLSIGLALIGTSANFNISIINLNNLFRGNKTALKIEYEVKNPKFKVPTFLDILLAEPQGVVNALDNIFQNVEEASLGRNGIITNNPIPYIRNSLAKSLGAGTDQNILARGRRKVIPALQAGLDSLGKPDSVAESLAVLLGKAVRSIGILRPGETVVVSCYFYDVKKAKNVTQSAQQITSCKPDATPRPTSIMWSIPFGQTFDVEVPLDFDLDVKKFPLEIEFSGNGNTSAPTLTIGWAFDLAFGFDEMNGFFLYTFPEGNDEFRVDCLLSVVDRKLDATLIFLKGGIQDLDLLVGGRLFINVDKARALGMDKEDRTSAKYGRLTAGDIRKIVKPSNMFSIGARIGAVLNATTIHFSLDTDSLSAEVAHWIPRLEASVYAQARSEIGSPTSTRLRRTLSETDSLHRCLGGLTEYKQHRAHPMFRELIIEDSILDDFLRAGYGLRYTKCPVNVAAGEKACIRLEEPKLDMSSIAELIEPILSKFVTVDSEGILDKVIDPAVLLLVKRLPAISDIMKKNITVLDIAEAFLGEKSGAPTVRKVVAIYNGMKSLADLFVANGSLLIAKQCDVLKGFSCQGGLFSSTSIRTRRLDPSLYSLFDYADTNGQPLSSPELVADERKLANCPSVFTPPTNCGDANSCAVENCPDLVDQSICNAKQMKCKGQSVEGLSFPFMNDLTQLLGLLQGKDIVSNESSL